MDDKSVNVRDLDMDVKFVNERRRHFCSCSLVWIIQLKDVDMNIKFGYIYTCLFEFERVWIIQLKVCG